MLDPPSLHQQGRPLGMLDPSECKAEHLRRPQGMLDPPSLHQQGRPLGKLEPSECKAEQDEWVAPLVDEPAGSWSALPEVSPPAQAEGVKLSQSIPKVIRVAGASGDKRGDLKSPRLHALFVHGTWFSERPGPVGGKWPSGMTRLVDYSHPCNCQDCAKQFISHRRDSDPVPPEYDELINESIYESDNDDAEGITSFDDMSSSG